MFSTFILLNLLAIVPVLSSAKDTFSFSTHFLAISFNVIAIIYFKTLIPGKSFPSKYSKNAPSAVDK